MTDGTYARGASSNETLAVDAGNAQIVSGFVRALREAALEDRLEPFVDETRSSAEAVARLSEALRALLQERRLLQALAESGVTPDRALLPALLVRVGGRLLPLDLPPDDVRGLVPAVFRPGDWRWIAGVDDAIWAKLFVELVTDDAAIGLPHDDVAAAILALAQRAGALGIDEEVNRCLADIGEYGSPFLNLTHEAREFVDDHAEGVGSAETLDTLLGTIAACRALVESVRANRGATGTSMRLTAVSRRLLQQLYRMEILVHLVHPRDRHDFARSIVPVFKEVIEAEQTAQSVVRLLRGHLDLFAYQITEETAKRGVKYVTDTAAGYWLFLRKALYGGAIVALFAIAKSMLGKLELSLAAEALSYSLNYAVCFVLIYLSGSILATKQPAMTAAAIGRRLDEAETEERAVEAVGEMIVNVWRSQFVSFVGNLACALPVAVVIAWTLGALGIEVASAAKSAKLLDEVHPWSSGALIFAAIAGVYLFASGVLSGWVDNFTTYVRFEHRLRRLPWPAVLRDRAPGYITENSGVLVGNLVLGFLLGTAGTIGFILGLPFDIRHIAFSSANIGIAMVGAPELVTVERLVPSLVGVLGIGFVNFIVSFGLTLATTLESRQASFSQWRSLGKNLMRRVVTTPRDWLLPPRDS